MSYILNFPNQRLVYFAIPKSANTSIKHWLLPLVGDDPLQYSKNGKFRNIHKQVPWTTINKLEFLDIKNQTLSFAVTRNPWERLVSVYKDKVLRRLHDPFKKLGFSDTMTILEFAELVSEINDQEADIHFKSQWLFITHRGHLLPNLIFDINQHNVPKTLIDNYLHPIKLGAFPVENKNTTHNFSFEELITKCNGDKGDNRDKFNELIGNRYKAEIHYLKMSSS